MMEINIINQNKETVGNLPLNKFWQAPYSVQVVSLAIRAYLANQRQGTSQVKKRGEVEGSTRKIYRQKGTGGARHGARYAPQFRGGGIAFGPNGEKNYQLQVNKKVKKRALQSILSKKMENKEVMIIKTINLTQPKTKEANNFLNQLGLEQKKILLIFSLQQQKEGSLEKAFRNLPKIITTTSQLINTYQVWAARQIIFASSEAFLETEKRLKNHA